MDEKNARRKNGGTNKLVKIRKQNIISSPTKLQNSKNNLPVRAVRRIIQSSLYSSYDIYCPVRSKIHNQ